MPIEDQQFAAIQSNPIVSWLLQPTLVVNFCTHLALLRTHRLGSGFGAFYLFWHRNRGKEYFFLFLVLLRVLLAGHLLEVKDPNLVGLRLVPRPRGQPVELDCVVGGSCGRASPICGIGPRKGAGIASTYRVRGTRHAGATRRGRR